VGSGPFPTELCAESPREYNRKDADYGEQLQSVGREFGATTGRKRRCGWLDLVLVKYSAQVNCYTLLSLTKLDVLDGLEEIKVATAYTVDGKTWKPFQPMASPEMEIVYKTFEGWQTTTTGYQKWDELPEKAKEYVTYIEEEVGVPVKWIGTGPRREDMIVR
jgi:adenylosuccinate synthase